MIQVIQISDFQHPTYHGLLTRLQISIFFFLINYLDGSKHTKEQNKQITFEAVKKEDKSHRKSTTTANDATTNSDIPLSESSTSKSKRKKSKKHHKKTQNETATYETTINEVLLPELGASEVVVVSESNPHQNDIQKASSLIVTPLPELGARNKSESNHRIDIEHDSESLLLATSGTIMQVLDF